MANQVTKTPKLDGEGSGQNLIPETAAQEFDLAEYKSNGKPLPVIVPSYLLFHYSDREENKEGSPHPLRGIRVLNYYPDSNKAPRSHTLQNSILSSTPPLPQLPVPGLTLPPLDIGGSVKDRQSLLYAALEKYQSDSLAKILEEDTNSQDYPKTKSLKKQHGNRVSNSSPYDTSRTNEKVEKQVINEASASTDGPEASSAETEASVSSASEKAVEESQVDSGCKNGAQSSKGKKKKKQKRRKKVVRRRR